MERLDPQGWERQLRAEWDRQDAEARERDRQSKARSYRNALRAEFHDVVVMTGFERLVQEIDCYLSFLLIAAQAA